MDTARPVVAYFLTAEDGCDPIMLDVLGVKREQIEGVKNPGQGQLERVDLGEDALRKLAREFLQKRGIEPPDAAPPQLSFLPDRAAPAPETSA